MATLTGADKRLRSWIGPVAGDVPVSFGVPADGGEDASITAYLIGLEPTTKLGGDSHRPAPVVVRLRYLVCADAPDPRRALELLDSVLEAALDAAGLEVDLTPMPVETWLALGVRPRPAFTVRLSAQHAREAEKTPVVRVPLRLTGATIRSLTGRLLGPGDVALAGSEVTLAATGATSRTSPSGAFVFRTVPAGPGPIRLAVRAKGRAFTVEVDPAEAEPVVVRCDLSEG